MEKENIRRRNIKIDNTKRELLINGVVNRMRATRDVARELEIPLANARKIIEGFLREGKMSLETPGRRPGFQKITEEMSGYLENLIEENSSISLEDLKVRLNSKYGVQVSTVTVRNELLKIGLTRKRVTVILERVNSLEIKEERRIFARNFMDNHANDSLNIFVDESGFNLHLKKTMGWSKKGRSAPSVVPTIRGTNISLISAISKDEVLFSCCKVGSVRSIDFIEFLERLVVICREKNIVGYTLFFDNASIHRSNLTTEYMDSVGLSYEFLSPYSYMLNPIEFAFSKVKAGVKRRLGLGLNHDDLGQTIQESIDEISHQDLCGYYHHIRRNCTAAIAFEDFSQ